MKSNAALSIVMEGPVTSKLKGLAKTEPYAVVLPHTLFYVDGKIRGVATYACSKHAEFEMTVQEFEQLSFSFVKRPD